MGKSLVLAGFPLMTTVSYGSTLLVLTGLFYMSRVLVGIVGLTLVHTVYLYPPAG